MSDVPQFIDLDGDGPQLPEDMQSMVQQLREPEVDVVNPARQPVSDTELLNILAAHDVDNTAKLAELMQMCLELNGAVQGLLRQAEADHQKIHQLEAKLKELDARTLGSMRFGPVPATAPKAVDLSNADKDAILRAARRNDSGPLQVYDTPLGVPHEPKLSPEQQNVNNVWDAANKEDQ